MDRVVICSIHDISLRWELKMIEEEGRGREGYAVNVPLKDGMTDEARTKDFFKCVFMPILNVFCSSRSSRRFWRLEWCI
jgi:acetoin utilization deacetylase AcuC-like enzyme